MPYQGEALTKRFDPAAQIDDDVSAIPSRAQCEFLLISFTNDWRFAPERSEEIVNAFLTTGKHMSYANIGPAEDHDAFLLPVPRYIAVLRGFLNHIYRHLAKAS